MLLQNPTPRVQSQNHQELLPLLLSKNPRQSGLILKMKLPKSQLEKLTSPTWRPILILTVWKHAVRRMSVTKSHKLVVLSLSAKRMLPSSAWKRQHAQLKTTLLKSRYSRNSLLMPLSKPMLISMISLPCTVELLPFPLRVPSRSSHQPPLVLLLLHPLCEKTRHP